jgi:4-hydroxy-tetrahydrodipicolinate synthase
MNEREAIRMTQSRRFGPVLTAMVTPLKADFSVDWAKAAALASHLVQNGSDGLVVAGTTGESPTLSPSEKLKLFHVVLEAVGDRATVIAGTGSYDTAETIHLSREAERVGVHGLLLVTPYYSRPPQEALFQHYWAVAEAVQTPCILYNVPSRTSVNLAATTTLRLAAHPKIVGIKECADLGQVAEILQGAPEDFTLWCGDDAMLLPYLAVGAHGVISVAAHLIGPTLQGLIRQFAAGDVTGAARIHREMLPLLKALFATSNPIGVKAALRLTGWDVGPLRLPLLPASEAEEGALRGALVAAGLVIRR